MGVSTQILLHLGCLNSPTAPQKREAGGAINAHPLYPNNQTNFASYCCNLRVYSPPISRFAYPVIF